MSPSSNIGHKKASEFCCSIIPFTHVVVIMLSNNFLKFAKFFFIIIFWQQLGKLFKNCVALIIRILLFRLNLLMATICSFVLVPVVISSNSSSLVY